MNIILIYYNKIVIYYWLRNQFVRGVWVKPTIERSHLCKLGQSNLWRWFGFWEKWGWYTSVVVRVDDSWLSTIGMVKRCSVSSIRRCSVSRVCKAGLVEANWLTSDLQRPCLGGSSRGNCVRRYRLVVGLLIYYLFV